MFAGTHLADVVRAGCGDGLERQLLAADAHEDLFHLTQEILLYVCRQKEKIYYSCRNNLKSAIALFKGVCGCAGLPRPPPQQRLHTFARYRAALVPPGWPLVSRFDEIIVWVTGGPLGFSLPILAGSELRTAQPHANKHLHPEICWSTVIHTDRSLFEAVQGFVPEFLIGRVLPDQLLLLLRQHKALLNLHPFGGGLHHGGHLWRRYKTSRCGQRRTGG